MNQGKNHLQPEQTWNCRIAKKSIPVSAFWIASMYRDCKKDGRATTNIKSQQNMKETSMKEISIANLFSFQHVQQHLNMKAANMSGEQDRMCLVSTSLPRMSEKMIHYKWHVPYKNKFKRTQMPYHNQAALLLWKYLLKLRHWDISRCTMRASVCGEWGCVCVRVCVCACPSWCCGDACTVGRPIRHCVYVYVRVWCSVCM